MAPPVLLTQCLQQDFVGALGPHEALPNGLHIGWEESRRLLGENPAEGPVARFMEWAQGRPPESLEIIHIRDWHDGADPAQRAHLAHFGSHCLKDTPGAAFVFPLVESEARPRRIVDGGGLNDFLGSPLASWLGTPERAPERLALIGVWTDVKITFLAYELRTRFPSARLALCSALVASRSRTQHHLALESLARVLEVEIFHTVGGFAEFLAGGSAQVAPLRFSESLRLEVDRPLADGDEPVLRYLYRHSARLKVQRLDGGFSGNTVLGAESVDERGFVEAPHVVKIGPREAMGRERVAFEKVENVLGNHAPRIADFVEIGERGAIKYRYASMGGGKGSTFQKTYASGVSLEVLSSILHSVFREQLGSFTKAAVAERVDLLAYYQFAAKWAPSIREKAAPLASVVDGDLLDFGQGRRLPHPARFYEADLELLSRRPPDRVPWAMVHGDLNGANIILDGHRNVWLIDFFHCHMGHALKDLLKLENDVLFIYTRIEDDLDEAEAFRISDALASFEDLSAPLPDAATLGLTRPAFTRAWETLRILRSFYPEIVKTDRDPYSQRLAHLRYAMHTLGFDESTIRQKRWALYSGARMAERIHLDDLPRSELRLDAVPVPSTSPGSLRLTLLPGRTDRGRDLERDVATLRREGVTHVVALLTAEEMEDFGVPDLLDAYRKAGLQVLHLPFVDQKVPDPADMDRLIAWTEASWAAGGRVLIHCVGGLGRSGLAAACLLKSHGRTSEQALVEVRKARSPRAVESAVQEKFLKDYLGGVSSAG